MEPRQPGRGPAASSRVAAAVATAMLALLVAAAVPSSASAEPSSAQADPTPAQADPTPAAVDSELVTALDTLGASRRWLQTSGLEPEVVVVPASTPGYEQLRAELIATAARRDALDAEILGHAVLLDSLVVARFDAVRHLATVDAATEARRADRSRVRVTLRNARAELELVLDARTQLAVEAYIGGRQRTIALALAPEADGGVPAARIAVELGQAASEELGWLEDSWRDWIGELEELLTGIDADIADLGEERDRVTAEIEGLAGRIGSEQTTLEDLRSERAAIESTVPSLVDRAADAHRSSWIGTTGMTPVVLDAYVSAANRARETMPACGVRWTTLAGIGFIESHHGVYGRSGPVLADGRTASRIFGVILDGEVEETAVITDTDGGALDGNAEFDRAVGPMQFIPGTWKRFATDGNDDGVTDPHNVYDAAAAAAAYLCHGRSMTTAAGLRAALLSYNHADRYVRAVSTAMAGYEQLDLADTSEAVAALRLGDDDTTF